MDFTKGLNESQKRAVLHNENPLLVLAGAGSGKTRVLTLRIARLVQEKRCKPQEILAVTFTNKAAQEMKERVASLTTQKTAETMTLCTFHSLGVRILREDGNLIGLKKSFSIIGEHEKISLFKTIMRSSGIRGVQKEDPQDLATRISLAKNASIDPKQYVTDKPEERKTAKVYSSYNKILMKQQSVDFDDLLLLPLQILSKYPDVLKKYQERYKYISVDEFQDTNTVQMRLAAMLSLPQNNIMVVGDDDQGIYSWRGAEIENILSFSSIYPNCTTVILDKNYRSTHQILAGAHAVVSKNRVRKQKKITAVAGEGDPIMHYKGDDEIDEAVWIADKIAFNHEHTSFKYSDHAILLRANAMMRRYEEELRRKNIPYKVSGATSFFERKEIKDIFAYLRFLANPEDELSMGRVLKVPHKGITPSSIELLDDFAALRKMSLWDAMERHKELEKIGESQHEKIDAFVTFCHKYQQLFATGQLSITARQMIAEIGYLEHLERASKDDKDPSRRLENVEEILHGLEIYEQKFKRKKPTLDGYIQEITLITSEKDEDEGQQNRGVVLMTLHKSKGLEFDVVFLSNLDKDYIPSPRSITEGKIDEERRLFYVGMTRAKKQLYLTFPGTKVFRGKVKTVTPCPFLNEIPEEFLDGKIGEKQDEEKIEFLDNFFKELKGQFSEKEHDVTDA